MLMSRWSKDENEVQPDTLKMRAWLKTAKGQEYKERSKEYSKTYRKKHKKQVRAKQKENYDKIRLEAISHYSKGTMKCACCKEAGIVFLSIDHIHGNGAAERRKIDPEGKMGGNGFVYWLKKNKWPKGYQILCYNCNFAKRTNKKCPHQTGEVAIPIREPKTIQC